MLSRDIVQHFHKPAKSSRQPGQTPVCRMLLPGDCTLHGIESPVGIVFKRWCDWQLIALDTNDRHTFPNSN
jgi:hypothetical protein